MVPRLFSILAVVALLAGLSLSTLMPEVANVTALVLMGIGVLLLFADRGAREVATRLPFLLVYGAGLALLLALILTATSIDHVASIIILAPLWLAGPYAGLIAKAPPRFLTPFALALMALIGTAAAAAVAGYDVFVLDQWRGGFSVNNPIHLADLAVSLGFFALIGLFSRHRLRWLALAGPLLALATVFLSGSRGPFLAFGVLAALSVVFFVVMVWRPGRRVIIPVGAVVVALLLVMPFLTVELGDRQFRLVDVVQEISSGDVAESSNSERVFMLQSAWGAFLASPIYGHGLIDYPKKAARFAPPENTFPPSQHLHNDIADFAVIGGSLGLLCYLMLLLAPVLGAFRADSGRRTELLFIALMASAGYFAMGLTNAMIGILTQTVLFALMVALIGVLSKDRQP